MTKKTETDKIDVINEQVIKCHHTRPRWHEDDYFTDKHITLPTAKTIIHMPWSKSGRVSNKI